MYIYIYTTMMMMMIDDDDDVFVSARYSVRFVAVCYSVLQCVAVCCSVRFVYCLSLLIMMKIDDDEDNDHHHRLSYFKVV